MSDNLKGWTVMVIDDEPDSVEVATMVLEHFEAEVIPAQSCQEALEMLKTEHPDVILCDLAMPHLSGWDFIEIVKQDPILSKIPVVALTAHAMIGDREKVLEAGFSGYLQKPFHPSSFAHDILEALSHNGSHTSNIL